MAKEMVATGQPLAAPACILCGGETTVTLRGDGKGGRCQELALAAALPLEGLHRCLVLAGGTDGNDGPTDAAGAIVDGATLSRAKAKGLQSRDYLNRNDAYHFFEALGDLLMTGPTRTNVMDVYLVLVGPDS
jgi:hydroxypyruvate reductase